MDDIDLFVSLLPENDRRYLYTYCGKRLLGGRQKLSGNKAGNFSKIPRPLFHPLYLYDGIRRRPTLVVGNDDFGKIDHLLYLALKDSCCGRTVIFIDGANNRHTLNQLYYWNKKWVGRHVFALTPHEDDLSHTWNPLWNTGLKTGPMVDLFFDAYNHTHTTPLSPPDSELLKEVLHEILDVLEESKLARNCVDVAQMLSDEKALEWLGAVAEGEGKEVFEDFLELIREIRPFSEKVTPLVQFLFLFKSWTVSSYNPSIHLPNLLHSPAVVYAGLPDVGTEEEKKCNAALGNLLIHHIEALLSKATNNDKTNRRSISIIINQAEKFMDAKLAEWMLKARCSELMLTCAVDNLAAFEKMNAGFLEQLKADMPNLVLYNPSDPTTAQWFASFLQAKQNEEGASPSTEIWAERIQQLRHHQYLLDISAAPQSPMLLAAPFLPPSTNRADYEYQREHYNLAEKPDFKAWRFCPLPEVSQEPNPTQDPNLTQEPDPNQEFDPDQNLLDESLLQNPQE